MLIYKKDDGKVIANIPDGQTYNYLGDNVESFEIENEPEDWYNYKIINGELIKLTDVEIYELIRYERLLTEEERLLKQLKPSLEEVREAEQTIKILTLIQEVI